MTVKGNVILVTALPGHEVYSQEFTDKVNAWKRAHQGGEVEYDPIRPPVDGISPNYVVAVHDCIIDPAELDEGGFLMIGDYQAYIGAATQVDDDGQVTSISAMLSLMLEELFVKGNYTEQEKRAVLMMPLKEFLGHCYSLDKNAVSQKYGINKKALLTGQLVKCPECGTGKLVIREGIVGCSKCQFTLGDIDDLPDLI